MVTAVGLSSEVLAAVRAHAAADAPLEACGLLLGERDRIARALPCRNVAADPGRTFEIDPAALLAAHRQARAGGPAVLGCYHSHPSGRAEPSVRDAADAAPDGRLWLILAGGEARLWRAVADGPHLGRFVPVASACEDEAPPPQVVRPTGVVDDR